MPKVDAKENSKKKRYWTMNMSFDIYDKAPGVFKWLNWLSIKAKVGFALWLLLKEYWSFRWTWNVWHNYMPFFYKDNEIKIKK
jgi:hypothetical protein